MQITSGGGQVSYSYYTDSSGTSTTNTTTTTDNQTASSGTTGDPPAAIYEPSVSSPDMSFIYTRPMMTAQALSAETLTAEEMSTPTDPQGIYDQWMIDLESAFQDYSANIYQTIDDGASSYTEDDKQALCDETDSWFQSKRDDLENLLIDADEAPKAALLQTADDELSMRKTAFHDQVGARIEYDVWNEALEQEAAIKKQAISDAICQSINEPTDSDQEQWMNQIDEWSTGMQQQLSDKLDAYPSEIHDAYISQGEPIAADMKQAILEVMSDKLTVRADAETAAGQYHQSWLSGVDGSASGFLADASKRLNSLSRISSQDLDQWSQKLDLWVTAQQSSYNSGLADQVDPSMTGVLHEYENVSADKLGDLRSTIWTSVSKLARQHNSRLVKPVDPKTVFSSGYNNSTYEFGLGESKVTMKLDQVSSSNSNNTWCYVVDANGQKRALSFTFANDSMTEKMRGYFKESNAYGTTISLGKLNSLMDKVRSTASSFGHINWNLLKSKVYGPDEKTKVSNWVSQLSDLFLSMKV